MARQKITGILCVFQDFLTQSAAILAAKICVEGCDLSARLYALAAQVYALYVQGEWVARQAFPQTAEGVYLDYHAQLRGLERKPPVAAEGTVRFTAGEASPAPRDIPQGTVCMTTGLVRFETSKPAVLAAGALSVDAPIRALVPAYKA